MLKNKCETSYCKNKAAAGRKLCNGCKMAKYRSKNPIQAAFYNLQTNAKRRGIFFGLTFEDFKKFCYETKYIAGKGRTKQSFTIDRIIEGPRPGYVASNIRILTNQENVQKEIDRRRSIKILVYDYKTKYAKVI